MSDTTDNPDPAGPTHDHESLAHEVEDYLSGDIEIEREALHDSVAHDYSTSSTGLVPLDKRRPIGHFIALWTTFAAGFSFLFVGTEVHDSGFTLLGTIGVTALGIGIYFAYAIFAAYLGSRTGQTMSLLTRSIFGVTGSYIVSALVFLGALGLGRVPGQPDGPDLGRPLQLGRGRGADDHLLRTDDLQQPIRLHRDQHVRPVCRHAADHPVDLVLGDQGADRPRRRRSAPTPRTSKASPSGR